MNNSDQHNEIGNNDKVVSFDSEMLILVDENDQEIGFQTKSSCHAEQGTLHRAFSLFIFNPEGELLLQKRSQNKKLWPLYWSNSCCSHPRAGEMMEQSINRRLRQELGMSSNLQYLYKFQYQVPYENIGAEHELCWVFVGSSSDSVVSNPLEIADWRYIKLDDLEREMTDSPEQFTPWFKMEWQRLSGEFRDSLPI